MSDDEQQGEAWERAAVAAAVEAHRRGADLGAWFASLAASVAAEIGDVDETLANRPGSWEAAALRSLLVGQVGEDGDGLEHHWLDVAGTGEPWRSHGDRVRAAAAEVEAAHAEWERADQAADAAAAAAAALSSDAEDEEADRVLDAEEAAQEALVRAADRLDRATAEADRLRVI